MKFYPLAVLALTAAACGSDSDQAGSASTKGADATVAEQSGTTLPVEQAHRPSSAGAPGQDTTPSGQAADSIPAPLQGRWALVAADCTSARGDAKGLLIVEPNGLRFYESRASLAKTIDRTGDTITAEFAFTGEGMEWKRRMTLKRDAEKLIRTAQGEEAAPAPLRYQRCAS